MLSKNDLKNYSFGTIEGYFNYISESIINGNTTQAKELFCCLNTKQKRLALKYYLGNNTDALKWLINHEVIL